MLDNICRLRAKCSATGRKPKLIFNITESNVIVDKLADLARYALATNISLNFSNLLMVKGSHADVNSCISKIEDLPDDQLLHAWEVLCDLPERMIAEKGNIPHMGRLYEVIKRKAESITLNRFVPGPDEVFYRSFAAAYPKNPNAYLRKIYRSFDQCHRGILICLGTGPIEFALPFPIGRLKYRFILIHRNENKVTFCNEQEVQTRSVLSFTPAEKTDTAEHVLMEILSYEEVKGTCQP
jgi:hypothetical protein